ncbi:MAG: acetyl-CoA carboxylase biotin carboxyl carrier protein subunit [Bacteroidetes bacterium]|jgi:biotin carboxyl carrier protein|nr:acetyl-CoA carboxylase biotin carboxyl carrier protein subunit [Bacteroidota bacterium]
MANGNAFKATVDDQYEFEDLKGELDLISTGEGKFHVIKDNHSYNAEVVSTNYNDKTFAVKVNGKVYDIQLADEYDILVKRLGLQIAAQQQVKDIIAPMPGMVLEVSVEAGEEVSEGTPLLILEAMKMENVIKSPGDGVVKAINVTKGEAVDKNYLLVEME